MEDHARYIALLKQPRTPENDKRIAAKVLQDLAYKSKQQKEAIAKAGGLEALLVLLRNAKGEDAKRAAIRALAELAENSVRGTLLELGGAEEAVRFLSRAREEDSKGAAARLLGGLSASDVNDRILAAGAQEPLFNLRRTAFSERNRFWAVRTVALLTQCRTHRPTQAAGMSADHLRAQLMSLIPQCRCTGTAAGAARSGDGGLEAVRCLADLAAGWQCLAGAVAADAMSLLAALLQHAQPVRQEQRVSLSAGSVKQLAAIAIQRVHFCRIKAIKTLEEKPTGLSAEAAESLLSLARGLHQGQSHSAIVAIRALSRCSLSIRKQFQALGASPGWLQDKADAFEDTELKEISTDEVMKCEEIGRGSFGTVYRGRFLGNDVAVKRPHFDGRNADDLHTFTKEARIMARVRSDFCVKIWAVCFEPGNLAIVMDLAGNGTVYDRLDEKRPLPTPEVLKWMAEASMGLSWLHERSYPVIHADLKPQNILLDSHFTAKLADFGVSICSSPSMQSQRTGQVQGTFLFLAPERFPPDPEQPGTKADVYALGLTMYIVARGGWGGFERPVNLLSTAVAPGERPDLRKLPTGLPKAYRDLVDSCWKQHPQQRPTATEAAEGLQLMRTEIPGGLASGWSDGFDGSPGHAGVVSLVGEVAKWSLIAGTCKERDLWFRGYWRPDERDWFAPWSNGVLELHQRGQCPEMLVIHYGLGSDGLPKYGENQGTYEIPFLEQNKIPYTPLGFKDFMQRFAQWS